MFRGWTLNHPQSLPPKSATQYRVLLCLKGSVTEMWEERAHFLQRQARVLCVAWGLVQRASGSTPAWRRGWELESIALARQMGTPFHFLRPPAPAGREQAPGAELQGKQQKCSWQSYFQENSCQISKINRKRWRRWKGINVKLWVVT